MPYTPTNWQMNVTPGNSTNMNHLETQYTEATQSFEQDLFSAFVFSGLVCTADGSTLNQLDTTAGVAFLLQTDGTLRRQSFSASTTGQFTTSVASTTYYLDINNDGTTSFGTSHSSNSHFLSVCQVTTGASGNISTVTDVRPTATTYLSGMLGQMAFSNMGLLTFNRTLSSSNQLMNLQQSFGLYSDNTATVFAGATNRLWLNAGGATGTQEIHIGPRSGSTALAGFRVLANNALFTPNSSGSPGSFQVAGAMTLSLDSGKILSDGLGTVSGTAGTAAPGAPTLGLTSGTNLGIGVYDYKITFTTSLGESPLGTLATITTTTSNQKINLTAIATGATGVTGRNIYRTEVGGSTYYLLHSLADNTTTTYSDTTADTSLVTAAPAHPSLGGDIWKSSGGSTVAQIFGDGAVSFAGGAFTVDNFGNAAAAGYYGGIGCVIPMTRNGSSISAPLMTGSSFPTNALPGAVFVMA